MCAGTCPARVKASKHLGRPDAVDLPVSGALAQRLARAGLCREVHHGRWPLELEQGIPCHRFGHVEGQQLRLSGQPVGPARIGVHLWMEGIGDEDACPAQAATWRGHTL